MKFVRIKFLTAMIEVPDNYPLLVNNKGIVAADIAVGDYADLFGDVVFVQKNVEVTFENQVKQQDERCERLKRYNWQLGWLLIATPFIMLILAAILRGSPE